MIVERAIAAKGRPSQSKESVKSTPPLAPTPPSLRPFFPMARSRESALGGAGAAPRGEERARQLRGWGAPGDDGHAPQSSRVKYLEALGHVQVGGGSVARSAGTSV